jgi:hypothetical protein
MIFFIFFIFDRFFGGVFWAFRNKGNSKTRKKKSEKIYLGSSQKMRVFFPSGFFFFLSFGCFVRFLFIAFFGRFVTRGAQKRD